MACTCLKVTVKAERAEGRCDKRRGEGEHSLENGGCKREGRRGNGCRRGPSILTTFAAPAGKTLNTEGVKGKGVLSNVLESGLGISASDSLSGACY